MKLHLRARVGALTLLSALTSTALAGTIGQWDGSGLDYLGQRTTWNNPTFFTEINAFVTTNGNTVTPDGPATAAALAGFDSFLMADPSRATNAAETAALLSFVTNGGNLMLLLDRESLNPNSTTDINTILAALGSSIRVSASSMDQNMYFVGGVFATTTPYYTVGGFLGGTPGRRVSGGTAMTAGGAGWTAGQAADAASYIHWEQLGLGYIFVFGDRFDNNVFTFSTSSTRGMMFLNLAAYDNPAHDTLPPSSDAPEPSTTLLAAAGLAWLIARKSSARRPK